MRRSSIKLIICIILIITVAGCNTLSEEEKEKFREAIKNDDRRYIEYILSKGVNLNDEKVFGYVPLHIAAGANNIELIELFLKHGANINSVDELKQNCLFKAYNINTVKYLIEQGANVNQVDMNGDTPLLNVGWNYELAKLYIEKGSDINHKDKEGDTILFYALMNDNYELIEYLIKRKKIKVKYKNNRGDNPLIWYSMVGVGNLKIANLLLNSGIDINDVNNTGINALIASILNIRCSRKVFKVKIYDLFHNIYYLDYLIKHKININHKENSNGNTALIYAIILGREKEIIKLLLDNGADVNIKNKNGKTPLDIAMEKGDKDIINLLKMYAKK